MNDFLQSAFDHFHSEVDLILGAPIPFFATIIVIAAIEYFLVSALSHDRLKAQRAKIRDLTKRVAKAETELREPMAAQDIRTAAEGIASVAPEIEQREAAVETISDSHGHGHEAESPATEFSARTSLEIETFPEHVPTPESVLAATQTAFPAPAAAHEHIAQQIADRAAQEAPSDEVEKSKIERPEDAPWQSHSPAASTSVPPLDISILNVHEGSRVGPVVEVEILSAIAMERLQACVFSSRTNQWYPQGPFWKNRGIPIATCRFGDEDNQTGDSFKLSIIETQTPLNGPVGTLPYDVPQTNPLTVYRGG